MKILIIISALIFITVSSVHSQDTTQRLNEIPKNGYKKTFAFSILQGITLEPVAMDYAQFDLGYYYSKIPN